ncbi:MAG: YceI family protein [Gemmatimonadota bacterium]
MNASHVRIASVAAALLLSGNYLRAQGAPPAPAAGLLHYTIDTVHSNVAFKVRHMGVSWVAGNFRSFSGAFDFDSVNVERSAVTARIGTASVDTDNERRDGDLKQNYLQVDSFPEMTFTSRRVERVDATHLRVMGDLTLHGVTRPVTLQTELTGMNALRRQTPDGRTVVNRLAAFTATTAISRREFGITINRLVDAVAVVGDEVRITIEVEARAAPPTP